MEVHVEIAAETLFNIGPIPVTNSMLTMFIVMAGILIAGWWIARKAQTIPTHSQSVVEMMIEFLLGLVEGTAGRKEGRRVFPLIGAIFIFILFANYSGLLPGVGTIGKWETETHEENGTTTEETTDEGALQVASTLFTVPSSMQDEAVTTEEEHEEETEEVLVPFFRAPNADLNMTIAMALVTFFVVQVRGFSVNGFVGRIKHMADPPFLFPLELIAEFSRIISLSARLFGNVLAGEVLLAVMYAMAAAIKIAVIPLLFPVVFLGLELLFGAIQALVFGLLTVVYVSLAASEHEEEHGEHGAEPVPTTPLGASAGD
jgi:F-type H+-transporting ATPase subunit a